MRPRLWETLLKCVAVASANDAAVALAEHISGSEGDFVKKMNQKAAELGMKNTHFVNCCGLDDDAHLTTARDVAVMSREILKNHPRSMNTVLFGGKYRTYHARGDFDSGLSNTNKLIKQYEYATGLKTGYTSVAGSASLPVQRKTILSWWQSLWEVQTVRAGSRMRLRC